MIVLKLLLLPFSLIYGCIMAIRNRLYDSEFLPSAGFDRAVIVIGNLSSGGTGKSPMTEYLVRLLQDKFTVATLSRGYGRKTSGFLLAPGQATAAEVGDEPAQFRKKFPALPVAVDGNRRRGIRKLIEKFPDLKAILLDDAFQHRRVRPGLSILLTDYHKMYYDDWVLPAGTLREFAAGKQRADIIVVTKCPAQLTPVEKRVYLKRIDAEPHQRVFFSSIRYGDFNALKGDRTLRTDELKQYEILLLTGISNPRPLADHLLAHAKKVVQQTYPDHHNFSVSEIEKLRQGFQALASPNRIVVTTEKDAMRLNRVELMEAIGELPVFYVPIETGFDPREKEEFNQLITDYVTRTDQKNSRLHPE